ncbi:MAG: type II toxin-antitoxin system VapC family toxin [Planctomycetota bacterium]
MSDRLYVDTSAYLCLLLGEEGSAPIANRLAQGRLHSSVLLVLEARRNLVRLARGGQIPPAKLNDLMERVRQDVEVFALKDLTMDLCSDPSLPAVTTPRSLDLAHLRTALWFHRREPLGGFVTLDEGQRQSARELGLPVV